MKTKDFKRVIADYPKFLAILDMQEGLNNEELESDFTFVYDIIDGVIKIVTDSENQIIVFII